MTATIPNLTIIGIGAMGSLFAARLSSVAHVSLLGNWPQQLEAIQQNGLTLIEPNGRIFNQPIHATNTISAIHPADIVLIMVKSHQTARAAQQAKQLLAPHGIVLTLQNGIGNLETLTAVLPQQSVALGITSEGATIVEPGTVRHAGWGHTDLASTPETAVQIASIAQLLEQAGFQVTIRHEVAGLVWGKLAVNAGINPLTALLGVPNGFLAEHDQARAIMIAAANEVAQVAQAQNIQLPFSDAGQCALEVAQATAANNSSMLQDVQRGAKTEIEVICGAVVRYGQKFNVPTPINTLLLAKIKELEELQPVDGRSESKPENLLLNLQSLISNLS